MAAADGTLAVVLVLDDLEIVVARVRPSADLVQIDALVRLQLYARRLGCSIRLRDVPIELNKLLDLFGLTDVVPAECRSPDEPKR